MTREDFEKTYEQAYHKTRHRVAAAFGHNVARDAVQDAAIYFLERLDNYERITPALFSHMAMKRAKDMLPRLITTVKDGQPVVRNKGKAYLLMEQLVGGPQELLAFEAVAYQQQNGRVKKHKGAE